MNNRSYFENILKNKQIPTVIVFLLCLAGIVAFLTMPRQQFPEFSVLEGLVIAGYPGASSEQVDAQVTKPLLDYLFQFEQVDRTQTYTVTKENQCVVFLYVVKGLKGPEIDVFWSKLRIGLNEFKVNLPAQVLLLEGDNDFGKTSAVLISISSEERSYRELESYLNKLSDMITAYPAVASVEKYGVQKEKVTVYVDRQSLAFYGIEPAVLISLFQMESLAEYGAKIETSTVTLPIHIGRQYASDAELADQVIWSAPSGNVVRLKDIARIERGYDIDGAFVESDGMRAVVLSIEMAGGNNIVEFGKYVDKIIETFKNGAPDDIKIVKISDMPGIVNTSIDHFFRDFAIAIASVVIVVILSLPLHIAAVSAFTIPISMLIGMLALRFMGMELNTVTLASLVLVLGMVVDDSLVVIDNHIEKLDHGMDLWTASYRSAEELFIPVITATAAIIMAFLPTTVFLKGMFKEFIAPAPVTVAVSLICSLLVATHFVPILSYKFIKHGVAQDAAKGKKKFLSVMQGFYEKYILPAAIDRPKNAICIAIICIAVGGGAFAFLPRQLFPKLEQNQFAAEIYFPAGTSIKKNARITKEISTLLLKDERVRNVIVFVGQSSPRFNTLYTPQLPADNYSQAIVVTGTSEQTVQVLQDYDAKYRDAFPDAHIRWKQLDFLPVDAPIEAHISGADTNTLKAFAEEVKKIMREETDVIWVRDDWRNPRMSVDVRLKKEQAMRVGVTRASLALSLAAGKSGIPLATIWDGDYEQPVILKYQSTAPAGGEDSAADILNSFVIAPALKSHVLLSEVADIQTGFSEGQIVRRNGVFSITVSGDVAFKKLTVPVFSKIKKKIEKLPDYNKVSVAYSGEHQMEMETYIPFAKSIAVSVVVIFLIMLFQFKRVKMALLVMFTMPLSIIGGVAGLLIIGYPFGMTSFMGFIGIMGIVVRNGVILVSYANELREQEGLSVPEAARAAGKRRMRPIFLTATAAIVGVVPLITSGSSLWGPLGTVICFGLIGATILTLYVLPAAYYLFCINEDVQKEQQIAAGNL